MKSFGLGDVVNGKRILCLHTLAGMKDSGLTFWVDISSGLMSIPMFDEEVDDGKL